MTEECLARFGQTLVRVDKLLAVRWAPAVGRTEAYAVLTYEGNVEIAIDATAGRALIESYPDKACRCPQPGW